ncbi:hypothetical protein BD560DRAFT_489416 [Blakeslea trispora]|nr:hypothetical protein BD560DRAFT_489416 [Blakeslea trispora]
MGIAFKGRKGSLPGYHTRTVYAATFVLHKKSQNIIDILETLPANSQIVSQSFLPVLASYPNEYIFANNNIPLQLHKKPLIRRSCVPRFCIIDGRIHQTWRQGIDPMDVWRQNVNLDQCYFRYQHLLPFHGMMLTDGVSVHPTSIRSLVANKKSWLAGVFRLILVAAATVPDEFPNDNEQPLYRKFRFCSYIYKQIANATLIRELSAQFDANAVFVIGN